jgi:CheY-like chemotaxis protein
MNILVIEDQPEKAEDISNFLESFYSIDINIDICESLRSGLMKTVLSDNIYLILLDMSMPMFDSDNDTAESRPESFAGREFIAQMKIREISIPIVVVTQYAVFEKGNITLQELDSEFRAGGSDFYMGCVYYQSSSDEWKSDLSEVLEKLNGEV